MLLAIFVLFAVVLRLLTLTALSKVRFPAPAFRVKFLFPSTVPLNLISPAPPPVSTVILFPNITV